MRLAILILSLVLFMDGVAVACDKYPVDGGKGKDPVYEGQLGETGLLLYGWDVNGDGKADFETVWQVTVDGKLAKWPLFYGFNLRPVPGDAGLIMIDKGGEGKCKDIKLHWKRPFNPKEYASAE